MLLLLFAQLLLLFPQLLPFSSAPFCWRERVTAVLLGREREGDGCAVEAAPFFLLPRPVALLGCPSNPSSWPLCVAASSSALPSSPSSTESCPSPQSVECEAEEARLECDWNAELAPLPLMGSAVANLAAVVLHGLHGWKADAGAGIERSAEESEWRRRDDRAAALIDGGRVVAFGVAVAVVMVVIGSLE